jgi:hypothetical protein
MYTPKLLITETKNIKFVQKAAALISGNRFVSNLI